MFELRRNNYDDISRTISLGCHDCSYLQFSFIPTTQQLQESYQKLIAREVNALIDFREFFMVLEMKYFLISKTDHLSRHKIMQKINQIIRMTSKITNLPLSMINILSVSYNLSKRQTSLAIINIVFYCTFLILAFKNSKLLYSLSNHSKTGDDAIIQLYNDVIVTSLPRRVNPLYFCSKTRHFIKTIENTAIFKPNKKV